MLKLDNIKIRKDIDENKILEIACKKYNIKFKDVKKHYIFSKSIDARNKKDIFYVYSILVFLDEKYEKKYKSLIYEEKKIEEVKLRRKSKLKPVIVGAGPAGLFAALTLCEYGIKPVIIEQGKKVEDRMKDVEDFVNNGKLNELSNVQFGEGGAGTFSDGKLTTGLHNVYCKSVLETFVRFGAPKEILYLNKPHIGTDNLVKIISNMREYIISKGGIFLFNEKVTDIILNDGMIQGVVCSKEIKTDTVILAIGHSARDTFSMLYNKGIKMDKKNFSVGVRIEHLQEDINKAQYGTETKLKLPPAEYKMAYHGKDRSCYTFCMCPGGVVMPSSSTNNTIVTNGMSKYARDGKNANSALLVEITPSDFKGESPLEGMYFQEELEKKAFIEGGKNYFAPIQTVGNFLKKENENKIGKVKPTYMPGTRLCDLKKILPEFVCDTLKEGILYFDKRLEGFADKEAILTAVETRSSSPVKILRDKDSLMSQSVKGLYPCGEGAGYAGGIMSAAIDGIKCARKAIELVL